MVDRDSIWGWNNGLPTIVTTTFQMNLNGYTLVLPDMIGGNGFNLNHAQADLPSKELFIRWLQANTFLPAMQYSFAPWNFDDEVSVIYLIQYPSSGVLIHSQNRSHAIISNIFELCSISRVARLVAIETHAVDE